MRQRKQEHRECRQLRAVLAEKFDIKRGQILKTGNSYSLDNKTHGCHCKGVSSQFTAARGGLRGLQTHGSDASKPVRNWKPIRGSSRPNIAKHRLSKPNITKHRPKKPTPTYVTHSTPGLGRCDSCHVEKHLHDLDLALLNRPCEHAVSLRSVWRPHRALPA